MHPLNGNRIKAPRGGTESRSRRDVFGEKQRMPEDGTIASSSSVAIRGGKNLHGYVITGAFEDAEPSATHSHWF